MVQRTDIEAYWEDPKTVSLLDSNLRALEESVVLGYLDGRSRLADFGCGAGESTVRYAARAATCVALEQSNHQRSLAAERFRQAGLTNVDLRGGSIGNLRLFGGCFDIGVTQRVIINLPTWSEQQQAIANIHSTIAPGGLYIMVENTYEGAENLNRVRRQLGLANIPLHWHNNFLHHDLLLDFLRSLFVVERIATFDLYYLLTRVFINMFASFEGYGAVAKADEIFKVSDAAARHLFEVTGNDVSIRLASGSSFGPIQAFVLRKIS
jgi:SAM-dependent methyltransferase